MTEEPKDDSPAPKVRRFGDPTCPCQDGDACHYVAVGDSPAVAVPAEYAENAISALERRVENSDRWWSRDVAAAAHQLHAARYYVHKIRVKVYGDAVANGTMVPEEAAFHYGLAMINFDKLMVSSRSGSVTAADQAEMDKGFHL